MQTKNWQASFQSDLILLKPLIFNMSTKVYSYSDSQDVANSVGKYVIEHPIDLATIEQKLENNLYLKFTDFVDDLKLMFNNCRAYNSETTTYYKNANKLEKFMNNKLKDCSFV